MYIVAGILMVFVVLPNTINFRERAAFSADNRLAWAQEHVPAGQGIDSIEIVPGAYYDRNAVHNLLFGKKYREIWTVPVKLPLIEFGTIGGGVLPVKVGGGQQTVGIDAEDPEGREWAVRSVNKDQSKALPSFLRPTLFRFMIRDQVAALNPYGALVVPTLAEAVGVLHTNPFLAVVAYDTAYGKYNERMAGRVTLVEEDADGSWKDAKIFLNADKILDTEDLDERLKKHDIKLDTVLYAKSRLLDILISDWDRHEGQWSWALYKTDTGEYVKPIPVDRDMAFYKFNEGLIPKFMLIFNNKFQSFNDDFGNLKGLGYQARHLDAAILPGITRDKFVALAADFKNKLPDSLIANAFSVYPDNVFRTIGEEHINTLKIRRDRLAEAAGKFYDLVIENREKNLIKE